MLTRDATVGEWQADMRWGSGLLTKHNRDTYEGSWAEDMYNGYGTLSTRYPRNTYSGTFVNGLFDGFGKLTCEDGSWYAPIHEMRLATRERCRACP